MADTFLSPAVGGAMHAVGAGLILWCARKAGRDLDDRRVPLMGVLGAFVFAAQMVNFTIPLTGSSGHIGGGLLLAILLGPHAAFLAIASVLVIQAIFFADGGLLALGCNIFNLGFFPCFVAYPLVYRRIVRGGLTRRRLIIGATLATVIGLQLGALCVVIQTVLSGISELPFRTFILLMLPIHVPIGVVEGLATAAVAGFVLRARPELLEAAPQPEGRRAMAFRTLLAVGVVAALLTGGIVAWFASPNPDGLEWAASRASGKEELAPPGTRVHSALARMQEKTALLPDYDLPGRADAGGGGASTTAPAEASTADEPYPYISAGRSISGIVGGAMTLVLAGAIGLALRRMSRRESGPV